jgi:transposase
MQVGLCSPIGWTSLDKYTVKFVIAVNPQYTSQECSNCGSIVKKTLSVRTHIRSCGCVLDRDENAAINILQRANTVGRTEIQARLTDYPLSIEVKA